MQSHNVKLYLSHGSRFSDKGLLLSAAHYTFCATLACEVDFWMTDFDDMI